MPADPFAVPRRSEARTSPGAPSTSRASRRRSMPARVHVGHEPRRVGPALDRAPPRRGDALRPSRARPGPGPRPPGSAATSAGYAWMWASMIPVAAHGPHFRRRGLARRAACTPPGRACRCPGPEWPPPTHGCAESRGWAAPPRGASRARPRAEISTVVRTTSTSPFDSSGTPDDDDRLASPGSAPKSSAIFCSIVPWGTISPPILEKRASLPLTITKPSSSIRARSQVTNQPSRKRGPRAGRRPGSARTRSAPSGAGRPVSPSATSSAGLGVDDPRRHPGQQAAHGPRPCCPPARRPSPSSIRGCGLVDVRHRRRLREAVALEDLDVKLLLEPVRKVLRELLGTGHDEVERAAGPPSSHAS